MKPTTENDKHKPLKNLSRYVYIVFTVRVIKLLLWVWEASDVARLVTLKTLLSCKSLQKLFKALRLQVPGLGQLADYAYPVGAIEL